MTEELNQKFKTFINGEYVSYTPVFIITGDTDSSYVDLSNIFYRDTDKKYVIEFADKLGEEVNSSFDSFMGEIFNVPKDRRSVIQTEREVVSDKSLFLAKKKYAMHVIDEEGVEKDKMKIMGMEIKKTDTPIIVQNFLGDLVDLLMDQATKEEVDDLIETFKIKYMESTMDDIGKPSNIKTLNKYYKKYEDNLANDELEDKMKSFPYHVRASMFYNSKCSISDHLISEGEKIKIIYIKHPDSKYIAFPTSADTLPKFLDELEIDWDTMWKKVLKKVDIYLAPIDYEGRTGKT